MARPKRVKLGERNAGALEKKAQRESESTPAPQPKQQKEPAQSEVAPSDVPRARTAERVPLTLYIPLEELKDSQAAYLADFQRGGPYDTFAMWIENVICGHAKRRLGQRVDEAKQLGPTKDVECVRTVHKIGADAMAALRSAVADEHRAGHWVSDAVWVRTAFAQAVSESKSHGPLPTPPPRLPRKLKR